jgi:hypothetical protein
MQVIPQHAIKAMLVLSTRKIVTARAAERSWDLGFWILGFWDATFYFLLLTTYYNGVRC